MAQERLLDETGRLILRNAVHHLLLVAAELGFAGLVKAGEWLGILSHHLVETLEHVTFWSLILTLITLAVTSVARIAIRSYVEVKHDVRSASKD